MSNTIPCPNTQVLAAFSIAQLTNSSNFCVQLSIGGTVYYMTPQSRFDLNILNAIQYQTAYSAQQYLGLFLQTLMSNPMTAINFWTDKDSNPNNL
jgi:hypothetical protein